MRKLHFGTALLIIHQSAKTAKAEGKENTVSMRLPFWNPNTRIQVQMPTNESMNTAPYTVVKSDKGIVPWIPNMIEMLSDQWEIHGVDFEV